MTLCRLGALFLIGCGPAAGPGPGPTTTHTGTPPVPGGDHDPIAVGAPNRFGEVDLPAWQELALSELAVTTDGAICVGGFVTLQYTSGAVNGMVGRLTATGVTDPDHGTDGLVPLGGTPIEQVAAGPDGGCFAASRQDDYSSFAGEVALVAADGTLDPRFVPWSNDLDGSDDQRILDLAGLSGGGVLVLRAGGGALAVVRLLADGTPDPAFGVDGVAAVPSPIDCTNTSLCDLGFVGARVGGGVLAVVGHPAHVVRLDEAGALDPRYGVGGVVPTRGEFRVFGASFAADGSTWLTGPGDSGSGQFPAVQAVFEAWDARGDALLASGTTTLPDWRFEVHDVQVRAEGGFALGGRVATDLGGGSAVVVRLDEAGSLDASSPGGGRELLGPPRTTFAAIVSLDAGGDGTLVGLGSGVSPWVFSR